MLAPNDTADSVIGYSGLTAILLISNYLSTLTGDTACQLRRESQGNCMKREAPLCPAAASKTSSRLQDIHKNNTLCQLLCTVCMAVNETFMQSDKLPYEMHALVSELNMSADVFWVFFFLGACLSRLNILSLHVHYICFIRV